MRAGQEGTTARKRTDANRDKPRSSTSGTTRMTVRNRDLTADDDANDGQALTGGDITRYRALVSRISYLSQDRPGLKFTSMQVCCAMAKPSLRDTERAKRSGRYFAGKPREKCWFRWKQSGELEAYPDADCGGD